MNFIFSYEFKSTVSYKYNSIIYLAYVYDLDDVTDTT